MIELTRKDFSINEVIETHKMRQNGAIVAFIGIVRDETDGKLVKRIEVEAYKEMAFRQLTKIRKEALGKFGVSEISVIHRIGSLEVSDNIVLIAVGAPHRDEAFKACRYVLEQLKKHVPIWKKEFNLENHRREGSEG